MSQNQRNEKRIKKARKDGDSLGGVECVIRHVPVGLGEPVLDKIKADLAKAMLSLPATMDLILLWFFCC